ncbi:MAG: hypothetical protein NTZ90_01960 [Proteobacteria bacterium]|nr:hypothetical protein [Pseudomonadota bacterium]
MGSASTTSGIDQFLAYPMGPRLRAYLGIADDLYQGSDSQRDARDAQAFTAFLRDFQPEPEIAAEQTPDAVVDLLDELVSMDLPEAVLNLASRYDEALFVHDFRAQLSLGVAAMLTGQQAQAEIHLRLAQELLPAEPAPYINLVQILLSQQRLDEAEAWALAGLDTEPNNFTLWDLTAEIMRERHGEYMPDTLMVLATKRCSWAGLSLAANLTSTGDRYLKATLLETLHQQGERDPLFLVELTGAYGIASEFSKIPPLVWQAERSTSKPLPWQLHVHCAQAQISLGQGEPALDQLTKAEVDPLLPEEARLALADLRVEATTLTEEKTPATLH